MCEMNEHNIIPCGLAGSSHRLLPALLLMIVCAVPCMALGNGYRVGNGAPTESPAPFYDNWIVWNGQHVGLSLGDIDICFGDTLEISVVTNDSIADHSIWSFGDMVLALGSRVSHCYSSPGDYNLRLIVRYSPYTEHPDTLWCNVHVHASDSVHSDTICCESTFNWNGLSISEDGEYSMILSNRYGCDSMHVYSVTFKPQYNDTSTADYCDSTVVDGIRYGTGEHVLSDTMTSIYGCDSIKNLILRVHPSYLVNENVVVMYGESYTWRDGNSYYSQPDDATVVYHSVYGCDSVYRLFLHVVTVPPAPPEPTFDSIALWVPNIFTPGEGTNREFKIFGIGLLDVDVSIFDRNGTLICRYDGMESSWNGTAKGHECQQGSYVYLIEYSTTDKPQYRRRKTGTVMLVR